MTPVSSDDFSATLSKYAPHVLEAVAERIGKTSRLRKGDAIERIAKTLANASAVEKILAGLGASERKALAVFGYAPSIHWRWDHAVRLATVCGVPSAYRSLQSLLGSGLLTMTSPSADGVVQRFELPGDLQSAIAPSVGLAAPLVKHQLDRTLELPPLAGEEGSHWRSVDGWDVPIRIGLLWQLARRLPIRKTQQNQLFKRDQERILQHPHLATGLLDSVEPIEDLGGLIYGLAREQGLLVEVDDEESPRTDLHEFWPGGLHDAMLASGRALLTLDFWNELGAQTPPGVFVVETATARFLALLLLSQLPAAQGAAVEHVADVIASLHPPFNAVGDMIGPMRHPAARIELAHDWTRAALLGPMYQLGLVEVGKAEAGATLVRLAPLARRLLGEAVELPTPPVFPQTLFVQPNHSIVVYRQGLTIELLSRLLQCAESRSIGAALTFELTADSVYRGLEAGLTAETVTEMLERFGGRELPAGVASSIKTWSRKRDRLTVYQSASLLEFSDPNDVDRALAVGLDGTRISERILLIAGEQERNLSTLRLLSTRDYRLPPEPCVAAEEDGVTLTIDVDRSDLLLDAELQRFALPAPGGNGQGRNRAVRVTPASIRTAVEQGLTSESLGDWFLRRTGDEPPASVKLLLHASNGLNLSSSRRWVVRTGLPEIAAGLLQHPATRALIADRLGPTSLAVADDRLDDLKRAALELGVDLRLSED